MIASQIFDLSRTSAYGHLSVLLEVGPANNEQDKRLVVFVDISEDIANQQLYEKIQEANESLLDFLRERPDVGSWVIGGQDAKLDGTVFRQDLDEYASNRAFG